MSRAQGLVAHVAEIRRHVGEQRQVVETIGVDELWPEPIELVSFGVRVAPETELAVDLFLESVSGGVTVVGTVTGRWTGVCRRCLTDVAGDLSVAIDETFEDRPTEGETYPITGDTMDLAPMVAESLLLALPPAPLCRDDCVGPEPDAFPVIIESDDALPPRDARWAGLDELRESLDP